MQFSYFFMFLMYFKGQKYRFFSFKIYNHLTIFAGEAAKKAS